MILVLDDMYEFLLTFDTRKHSSPSFNVTMTSESQNIGIYGFGILIAQTLDFRPKT